MILKNLYKNILSKFPQKFSFCFAYGSGVKTQLGYDTVTRKEAMVDFIFVVDQADTRKWHYENIKRFPAHYSGFKWLGSNMITSYQNQLGAGVYFNTLIPLPDLGVSIKYGCVTTENLMKDLREWNVLYLAGRLHKPVDIIYEPTVAIDRAVRKNLKNAIHASLLLLPHKFSEYDLYMEVARLSYDGDFRMVFGEKKDKVHNIVEPQLAGFRSLYAETLEKYFEGHLVETATSKYEQNLAESSRIYHLENLPMVLRRNILNRFSTSSKKFDDYESVLIEELARDQSHSKIVKKCLKSIVFRSSVKQSIKNIPSAGFIKSIRYSWKKSLKTFNL